MRLTVEKDGKEATVTAPLDAVEVDGVLDEVSRNEIRARLQDLTTTSADACWYYDRRAQGVPITVGSEEWLAIACLLELPRMGYRVGVIAEPEGAR